MISYASKGSRRGVDVPTVEFVQIEFVLVPCPSRVHSDNEALLILVLVVVDEEQHLGRLCRSSELEFHVPGRLGRNWNTSVVPEFKYVRPVGPQLEHLVLLVSVGVRDLLGTVLLSAQLDRVPVGDEGFLGDGCHEARARDLGGARTLRRYLGQRVTCHEVHQHVDPSLLQRSERERDCLELGAQRELCLWAVHVEEVWL
mmetsp:Transcript_10493/g.24714  ORF Transcript_10493/g.24714 Transcript_10493/m.24714 type:complete len:200 (+) Transcript_10493:26-625(+)